MPLMAGFRRLRTRVVRWQYGRIARLLTETDPERIEAVARRRFCEQVERARKRCAWYADLPPKPRGAETDRGKFEAYLRAIPIQDKSIFEQRDIAALLAAPDQQALETIYASSGSSSVFSVGADVRGSLQGAGLRAEFFLDRLFHILERRTLVVNCLPMGIQVPTATLPVINCGLRDDAIIHLFRKLHGGFEQTIFIGEHLFLKKIFESLAEEIPGFAGLTVHAIVGGEFLPESLRDYLAGVAGFDFVRPENGMMHFVMGASELALNIMFETPAAIRLRRRLEADRGLRDRFCRPTGLPCAPHVFQYLPNENFLETNPDRELIVTPLGRARPIPLIRYNTRDAAQLLSHAACSRELTALGLADLGSEYQLPYCLLEGKVGGGTTAGGIGPNHVKHELYRIPELAAAVTGFFRIQRDGSDIGIQFQAKPGREVSSAAGGRLRDALGAYAVHGAPRLVFLPFTEYPYNQVTDYGRKPRFLADGT